MAKYTMGESIIISIIIGSILLYLLGISGVFSLFIIGFIATYLTVESERSYKVGGIAGAFLGIILFIFSFLTPPDLPYDLDFSVSLAMGGIITLGLGFILLILICYVFGSLGGLFAEKMLKKRIKTRKYGNNMNQRKFKNKKPKKANKSLQRSYK